MKTVGIVGTGTMGCAAAAKLLEAGWRVVGYDAFAGCVERGKKTGIDMLPSLKDLASVAEKIILFLPGPAEIAACVAGEDGLLPNALPGAIIIDMCTSAPDATEAMAKRAAEKGVRYIDAPVLGRPQTAGKWALPCGGDAAAIAECEELFAPVASRVIPVGASGAGHRVKLLNQLMFGAINAITAEMMAVAEAVGVPPAVAYETITASNAATVSGLFRELGARVGIEKYDDPVFTVRLLTKDVRLGVEMADKAGAPTTIGRAVDYLNKAALAQGFGEQDTSVMWKSVKNFWSDRT